MTGGHRCNDNLEWQPCANVDCVDGYVYYADAGGHTVQQGFCDECLGDGYIFICKLCGNIFNDDVPRRKKNE